MHRHIDRRAFLAAAGGVCAGAVFSPPIPRLGAAEGPRARWRVTVRDAMLKHAGPTDVWSAARAIRAEGMEAAIGDDLALTGLFHPTVKYTAATKEGIGQVLADAKAAGQKITAFCMFNRFEERPDMEVEWCGRVAQAAKEMDVPAIRIDVVPKKMQKAEFLAFAIATLRKVMAVTEGTGVRFGIENHGRITNDPEFLKPLFDGVGSDRLGLTMDTGNFYWFGHPLSRVYQLYETFAPRAFHTHCKSIRYPESEREKQREIGWKYGEYHGSICGGDIDFARVASILRKARYANDLCIENESLGKLPPGEALTTLVKEVTLLKKCRDGGDEAR